MEFFKRQIKGMRASATFRIHLTGSNEENNQFFHYHVESGTSLIWYTTYVVRLSKVMYR